MTNIRLDNRVYLKKEKIFLTWENNVLNYKTDRINKFILTNYPTLKNL